MSNTVVGDIYKQVIDRVKQESAEIFEEAGIAASVLDELEQGWQANLSQTKVAQFPWDTPAAAPAEPEAVGIPDLAEVDSSSQQLPGMFDGPNQSMGGYGGYEAPKSFTGSSLNTQAAHERAASLLREKYGTQASASIAAGMAQQKQPAGTISQESQYDVDAKPAPSQDPLANPLGQTSADASLSAGSGSATNQPGVLSPGLDHKGLFDPSQTDGADDWRQFISQDKSETAKADSRVNEMIDTNSESYSGLMKALEKQSAKEARAAARPDAAKRKKGKIPQVDGEYDDDDDDDEDDLINSDLDDPDEIHPGGEDEMESFVVCTYAKVARVKTKWKAELMDGIMKTEGKNYLFHRSVTELEW